MQVSKSSCVMLHATSNRVLSVNCLHTLMLQNEIHLKMPTGRLKLVDFFEYAVDEFYSTLPQCHKQRNT